VQQRRKRQLSMRLQVRLQLQRRAAGPPQLSTELAALAQGEAAAAADARREYSELYELREQDLAEEQAMAAHQHLEVQELAFRAQRAQAAEAAAEAASEARRSMLAKHATQLESAVAAAMADFRHGLSAAPTAVAPNPGSPREQRWQPLLAQMIRMQLDGLPSRLPPPFHLFHATALQFAVGSVGSGSPQHFHDDAFNVLLMGRKCWWFWPPALAAMSRVHPLKLVSSGASELQGALRVVQEAGDIIYVPSAWGHAVLNEAEYNVCIAVEFEG